MRTYADTSLLDDSQGFTVVENFFTLGEIESARESFRQLVDEIAQKLYKSGRIKSKWYIYTTYRVNLKGVKKVRSEIKLLFF